MEENKQGESKEVRDEAPHGRARRRSCQSHHVFSFSRPCSDRNHEKEEDHAFKVNDMDD